MPGIFLTRGSRFDIPELIFEEFPDGSVKGPDNVSLRITTDMYPQWLRIAVQQTILANEAASTVDAVWPSGVVDDQASAIEAEQRATMLAIVAVAASFDGLFGTIADIAPLDQATIDAWRRNRTSRDARICEALRCRFSIPEVEFRKIKELLRQIFSLRHEAVHPISKTDDPPVHPRIHVGVERRFMMFRAENAHNATLMTLRIFLMLSQSPRREFTKLVEHCEYAREWLGQLRSKWEELYVKLFD